MNLTNYKEKIEWVFFDLDGTLANSISSLFKVYMDFLQEFGIPADENDLSQLNGLSLTEIILFLKSKYNINKSSEDLLNLYKLKLVQIYEKEVMPMEGAGEVLQHLHRLFKIQLVTSGGKTEVMPFVNRHGWANFIDSYVFGDEVSCGKPNPEIYKLAISKTCCSSKAIITIEDSPNGVKASNEAGLITIGFSNTILPKKLIEAGAVSVIKNLFDLIPILEQNID